MAAGAANPNGISSPADGAVVSGTISVAGTANDASFKKWQLDLLIGGDPNQPAYLASGTTAGDFTQSVNTWTWPDGVYALRLRIVKTDSNFTTFTNKITIANKGTPAATAAATTATAAATPTVAAATATVAAAATTAAAAATTATTNGISAPADGSAVSGTINVAGYANDPSFKKWQLDLLLGGDSNKPVFLGTATTAGSFTQSVNTWTWPDGKYALRLRVVKQDGNYKEYAVNISIANKGAPAATTAAATATAAPAATAAATAAPMAVATPTATTTPNAITAPAEGDTVAGTISVTGYANDPSFKKWQLDLLLGADNNRPVFLASGTTGGAFTQSLSTWTLPDGAYALRLRIVKQDSNYTEIVRKITIKNH